MAAVTIVLADTPTGGIALRTDFVPAIGKSTTLAQAAAMDLINQFNRHYGHVTPFLTITPTPRAVPNPETPTP